jgi:hypothetical protein
VPRRVIIDNAKCAITKACAQDPTVQRAYAQCAEGCGFKIDARLDLGGDAVLQISRP